MGTAEANRMLSNSGDNAMLAGSPAQAAGNIQQMANI
jgi:hypothetical protein